MRQDHPALQRNPTISSLAVRRQSLRTLASAPRERDVGRDRVTHGGGGRSNNRLGVLFKAKTMNEVSHSCCCCCLLLQYLIQSCARGGKRIVENMCYEIRRAEA